MSEGVLFVWPFYLDTEEKRLLFLQIIASGLPESDAFFLCSVLETMRDQPDMNANEIGEHSYMGKRAALVHLHRLAGKGFVIRTGHRHWRVCDPLEYH